MLAFYTVLNSSRSFWQHSSDRIFVLATFEDLAVTKQLSDFIHGSLKFLCRLVYWIKKIVMKDIVISNTVFGYKKGSKSDLNIDFQSAINKLYSIILVGFLKK